MSEDSKAPGGYVTDVEYTGDFYAHTAPAWLAYIAAINGHRAPRLDREFSWLDLGCGKGVTALLLAASHPRGQFHGCDFNPPHIAWADALKAAAGLANAHFYAKTFGQMLEEKLPAFDFITLHGVYSWVPPQAREEIFAVLRRLLKPGGLVMVSYNTLPGWAHILPIRTMLRDYAARVQGDSLEQARQAYAYVAALAERGAGYFAASPAAAQHLKEMAKEDIRYIAHEYLTPYGQPFYFAEVEAAMQDAGLAYCGSMSAADNYPELMLPERFTSLLPPEAPRSQREAQHDVILNTRFRRDLYVAAEPVNQPQDLPLSAFDGLAFCLTNLPERLPLKVSTGELRFDLSGNADAVRAVHTMLARGPTNVPTLHAGLRMQPGMRTQTEGETAFLLQQLVVSQHVAPCAGARAPAGWNATASAMVDAGLREQWPQVPLPCPASGSSLYCETLQAAALQASARHADEQGAGQALLTSVRANRHPVKRSEADGGGRDATDGEIAEYGAATNRTLKDAQNPDTRLLRLHGLLA